MEENKYITPEVEVLEIYAEGVLCGSLDQDLDMDPEEGSMKIAGRAGNDALCHSRRPVSFPT